MTIKNVSIANVAIGDADDVRNLFAGVAQASDDDIGEELRRFIRRFGLGGAWTPTS